MPSLAEKFHELFKGLERAHGHFVEGEKPAPGEKHEKKQAWTRKTGATVDLWERHLAGKYALGVPPLRDDGTVRWAAIDIDVYDMVHADLYQMIQEKRLPLVLARSKSGGAHGLVFFSEDVPATDVRPILLNWALALGCSPGVEIFPKQDRLTPTEQGNWLNMPYFGGRYSVRYGIGPSGSLTPDEFLAAAATAMLSRAQLLAVPSQAPLAPRQGSGGSAVAADPDKGSGRLAARTAAPAQPLDVDWTNAPPCMQLFADTGYQAGARNNALFNLAVLARKMDPERWADQLHDLNQRYIQPPLARSEVVTIVKSLKKKAYNYKCGDVPIAAHCQKDVCLQRLYGVAASASGFVFEIAVTKIVRVEADPIIWELYTDEDKKVVCTTEQLFTQKEFLKRCAEVLGVIPEPIKPAQWLGLVRTWINDMTIRQVPEDATPAGQILVYLDRYCSDRSAARNEDEILLGKPYSNGDGYTYFQSADFLKYLRQQSLPQIKPSEVYHILEQKRGAKSEMRDLKGKRVRIWGVLSMARQTAPFEPPRLQQEHEF
jgi:hypothetical protein